MTVRIKQLPESYALPFTIQGEEARFNELYDMRILDALSEERFDRYTQLLVDTLDMAGALVALLDDGPFWFKSSNGLQLSANQEDFCTFALQGSSEEPLILNDAASDARFSRHSAVDVTAGIRFYAGTRLYGPSGQVRGVCAVFDSRPRGLSESQNAFLRQAIALLERETQDREIVTELRESIKSQTLLDPLTRLPNLTLFNGRVDQRIQRLDLDKEEMLVAAIRLNRYDALDSALGRLGAAHFVGDVVARITQLSASNSIVGQIREDELALAVPFARALDDPQRLLSALAACFKRPVVLGNRSFLIPASIGASRCPGDATDAPSLLRRARIALRSTDSAEGSQARLYSPRLSTQTDRNFTLEVELARAIEEQREFYFVYQPKVSLTTHKICGAEALLRWRNDELGDVKPSVFIPIAERLGLLDELGEWIISSVCRQLSHWARKGMDRLEVSVNVSGTQLRQESFLERVVRLIEAHEIRPDCLNLEITESSLIEDIDRATQVMSELRKHSVTFSIDDFGTGFSSLSYLSMMPISVLKIDRSFVQHIPDSHNDSTIAQSVIALGHGLGLRVVAEGVENVAQIKFLTANECNEAQGYFFCKHLSSAMLEQLFVGDARLPIEKHSASDETA